jgi:uncharacterized protein (TIGR00255 family)
MTGYGRGAGGGEGGGFAVEIKAVNHRYCEISIKLPRILNAFEERIRARITRDVSRGKVDVFVRYRPGAAGCGVRPNIPLALSYAGALIELKAAVPACFADDLTITALAAMPDVIEAETKDPDGDELERLWPALEAALDGALKQFAGMRAAEGLSLMADLAVKAENLRRLTKEAAARAPLTARLYQSKLAAKMREILSGAAYDETRLMTEVAVFAEKADIDEEITRLTSHLGQFAGMLQSGGAIGRKLDFIIQEMNREANTIASKAGDIEISRVAVEMKGEIEKIREQAQNIE